MNSSRYECIQKCLGRRLRKKLNPVVGGQKTGQRTGSSETTAQSSTQGLKVKRNIQSQENLSDRTTNSQGTRSETTITSESEQETLSTSIPPSPAQQYAAQDRQSSPGETYRRKMVVVDKLHLPSTPSPKGKHTTSSYRLVGWELPAALLSDL